MLLAIHPNAPIGQTALNKDSKRNASCKVHIPSKLLRLDMSDYKTIVLVSEKNNFNARTPKTSRKSMI